MSAFHNNSTSPLVLNFGGGVDSTAILVGLVGLYKAGDATARPVLILFADTGNEIAATYAHVDAFSAWLVEQGFPAVTKVSRSGNIATKVSYTSIDGNCIANETLPSEAFNRGSCSIKWKHDPMGAFLNGRKRPFRQGWLAANGFDCKPTKMIGYDAGEAAKGKRGKWAKVPESAEAFFRYPLVEWNWTRQDCIDAIEAAGVTAPPKSACAMCPNQKPAELDAQFVSDKGLLFRSLVVEQVARVGIIGFEIKGLWRNGTKAKPGSWVQHAIDQEWMPELEAHVGTTLDAEVLRIFIEKRDNLDAGGYIPFRVKTLVKLFGEGTKAEHHGRIRAHYTAVIDSLSAKLANGTTARLA